jgi:hypothetical protein
MNSHPNENYIEEYEKSYLKYVSDKGVESEIPSTRALKISDLLNPE